MRVGRRGALREAHGEAAVPVGEEAAEQATTGAATPGRPGGGEQGARVRVLAALEARRPRPRRPRQGLHRYLPAATPGHRQSHQVPGTLINHRFKPMGQFNSKCPAIARFLVNRR